MGSEKIRIWITAAGTSTSNGLIRSIRESFQDQIFLIGSDINPEHLVPISKNVNKYEKSPPFKDETFRERFLKTVNELEPDIIIPILDEEISLIPRLVEKFDLPVKIVAPQIGSSDIVTDKLKAYELMINYGIDTPKTWIATDSPNCNPPWIIKPRRGVGSVGVEILNSIEDMKSIKSKLLDLDQYIMQESCSPPEFTIDTVIIPSKDIFAFACRERLETKAGVCTKARIFMDDDLGDMARKIGACFSLDGAFCFQVMMDKNNPGKYLVTDINPRVGGGTRLSVIAGFNIHSILISHLIGASIRNDWLKLNSSEVYVTRQFQEVLM